MGGFYGKFFSQVAVARDGSGAMVVGESWPVRERRWWLQRGSVESGVGMSIGALECRAESCSGSLGARRWWALVGKRCESFDLGWVRAGIFYPLSRYLTLCSISVRQLQ